MKYVWTILLLPLVACASDELEFEEPARTQVEAVTQSAGVIWAEYGSRAESVSVQAQFVRVQGISANQAMAALDVWRPDTDLALDACVVRDGASFDGGDEVVVELLDAGALTITSPVGESWIQGRRLPDIGQVSGVVYGSEAGFGRDAVVIPYAPGANYRWTATGAEVGAFDVEVMAPEVPLVLSATRQDGDVTLTWVATESPSSLYLTVEAPGGGEIECRLEDDGVFALPTSLLAPFFSAGEGGELVLRRVVAEPIHVSGIDDTQLVFGARDSLFLFW